MSLGDRIRSEVGRRYGRDAVFMVGFDPGSLEGGYLVVGQNGASYRISAADDLIRASSVVEAYDVNGFNPSVLDLGDWTWVPVVVPWRSEG